MRLSASVRYLELADFLLIAEKVLGVPAETLARLPRMDLAGGQAGRRAKGLYFRGLRRPNPRLEVWGSLWGLVWGMTSYVRHRDGLDHRSGHRRHQDGDGVCDERAPGQSTAAAHDQPGGRSDAQRCPLERHVRQEAHQLRAVAAYGSAHCEWAADDDRGDDRVAYQACRAVLGPAGAGEDDRRGQHPEVVQQDARALTGAPVQRRVRRAPRRERRDQSSEQHTGSGQPDREHPNGSDTPDVTAWTAHEGERRLAGERAHRRPLSAAGLHGAVSGS
jgi:hypothetical protein